MECLNAAFDPRPTKYNNNTMMLKFVCISINVDFISFIRYLFIFYLLLFFFFHFLLHSLRSWLCIDGNSIAAMFFIQIFVIFIILNLKMNNELILTEKVCFQTSFGAMYCYVPWYFVWLTHYYDQEFKNLYLEYAYIAFHALFFIIAPFLANHTKFYSTARL